jgi:hypothetical protein
LTCGIDANRAWTAWQRFFIRFIVDGWDTNKALEEATALGLTNETLKQFFVAQIQQRTR